MLIIFGIILVVIGLICFYIPIEDHLLKNHSKTFIRKHTRGFFKKLFLLEFLDELKIIWYIPYIINWLIFTISIPLQILLWLNSDYEDSVFIIYFVWLEIRVLGLELLLKMVFIPLFFQINEDRKKHNTKSVIMLSCCFLVLLVWFLIEIMTNQTNN